MKKVRAFYFAKQNNRLGYDDNRLVRVGVTHSVDCKPECCKQGLHASRNVFDALQYSSSSKLYLVDIWGDIHEQKDKLCGTHREYIARFDANNLLRKFARQQALINIEKIKPYTDDYELILRYLKTGDESIRLAAKSAFERAAWSASKSASKSAAWSASKSASKSAAKSAFERAAWSAAWSAFESAIESAAMSAASDELQGLILEATGWEL